jgi:hypothetical protein
MNKMDIDLSKLSPMIREKICRSIRQILALEAQEISLVLQDWFIAGGSTNCSVHNPAYQEMKNWEKECWKLHTQMASIIKSN